MLWSKKEMDGNGWIFQVKTPSRSKQSPEQVEGAYMVKLCESVIPS